MDKISSFEPIIDSKSRVLILGSIPGQESLNRKEYYAHPRNQLWKIVFGLFNMPVEENYEKKTLFIKSKGIALISTSPARTVLFEKKFDDWKIIKDFLKK